MSPPPSTRQIGRAMIDKSLALAAAGKTDAARILLDQMAADHDRLSAFELGPTTLLGLPRKLHAAYLKLAKIENDPTRIIGLQHSLMPDPQVLSEFSRFSDAEKRVMTERNREPVPRVLHQIWLGNKSVPPATQAWATYSVRHGLTYRLWREADIRDAGFEDHPSFRSMLERGDYPGAVDVVRYLILARFGGIYLDCDWYPARDELGFDAVLPLVGLAALAEETPRQTGLGSLLLTNSFIAAPPAHPVFDRLLAAMPEAMARLPDSPAWWSTGPVLFTVVWRGTSFAIPDASFVFKTLARLAPFSEVERTRQEAGAREGSLLIGWKSW